MPRLDWLPDVLRSAGLDVYVMPGAETRGRADIDPEGVVCHHTATGTNWQDGHVAALLRDGRRDLAGPLSQLGLERDGTFVVVALGRANHNGYGEWGNDSIGIEAYNRGDGIDPWPPVQLDAYQRGCAAILRHLGYGVDRCKAHRETDPKRKPDPTGIDMNDFRAAVARHLEGDDMPTIDEVKQAVRDVLNEVQAVGTSSGTEAIRETLNVSRSTLNGVVRLLRGEGAVDVDEEALAAELAPAVAQLIPALSSDDLKRIAKAVADEEHRRMAS